MGVGVGVGVGVGAVDEIGDVVEAGAEPPQPMKIATITANRTFPIPRTQALMDFSR